MWPTPSLFLPQMPRPQSLALVCASTGGGLRSDLLFSNIFDDLKPSLEKPMIKVIKAGVASIEKRKIDPEIQRTVTNIIDQIAAEGNRGLRPLPAKFPKWDR